MSAPDQQHETTAGHWPLLGKGLKRYCKSECDSHDYVIVGASALIHWLSISTASCKDTCVNPLQLWYCPVLQIPAFPGAGLSRNSGCFSYFSWEWPPLLLSQLDLSAIPDGSTTVPGIFPV